MTITVAQGAPVITSPTSASGGVNNPFSYQITARNGATSYSATGLRDDLTLNSSTGLISGTPVNAGTVPITVSATSSAGTGSENVLITIAASQ